jgi:polyhydroxyalkanoate synthesis regulator phasin
MDGQDSSAEGPEQRAAEGGVAESLRTAVERTMRATAGSAEATRERAAELVDEVVRRGRDARDELTRRGQEAGLGLARRGQEATGEVGRRIELLETRLAELERALAAGSVKPGAEQSEDDAARPESIPKPEG